MQNRIIVTTTQKNNPTIKKPKESQETSYLWSANLILELHILLSWVMSSISHQNFKPCLINSSHIFLDRHLPFLHSRRLIISHLFTGTSTLLLFMWPNHLSLLSLIVSSMGATLTLSLITTFLFLSNHQVPIPLQSRIAAHHRIIL